MFESFGEFLAWLATPAGLGLAVVALVAALKRAPAPIGEAVRDHALAVSVALTVVLAALTEIARAAGLEQYIAPYWQTVLLVWVVSQGIYNAQKAVQEAGGNDNPGL